MRRWKLIVLAVAFFLVLPYVVFRVALSGLAAWSEGWHAATPEDAQNAWVVAILPAAASGTDSVQPVRLSEVEAFMGVHPDATFLLPPGRDSAVAERLTHEPWALPWATLRVEPLSDTSQQITFEDMDRTDDTHGARYLATRTRVTLQAYRYVGDRSGIGVILAAMGITAVVEVLAVVGLVAFLVRRSRAGTRTEAPA